MDEERNWDELLSSIDALDKRLQTIEEYRRNAPDMSDKALRDMREELNLIRAALGLPEADRPQAGTAILRESETKWNYRTAPAARWPKAPWDKTVRPYGGRSADGAQAEGDSNVHTAPPVRKVRHLSERNLGKYLLGVLAAVLVLLAAVVLIAAVWPVIPDGLKFLVLLACGVGLQLVGMRFVLRFDNQRNGFWLSITGLGAGVSLMAVAAGCLAWELYPMSLAGILAAVWFGCNLVSARNLDSPVFYVIAYIGAALTVMLSVNLASANFTPFRLADQIPVVVMPILILGLGDFAASRHPRRCLRVLNYLASLFFIYILGMFAAELPFYVDVDLENIYAFIFSPAPGVIVAPTILIIFAHLIHISPDALERREHTDLDWIRVFAVVAAGFVGMFAVYRGVNSVAAYMSEFAGGNPTVIVTGAAVSLVEAAVIMIRKDQRDYLVLGLVVPVTLLFAFVSDSLFDVPCLLPVLLCALLSVLNRGRDSFQLALWLSIGLSGIMAVCLISRRMEWYLYGADVEEIRYVILFLAAYFIYLIVLGLTYARELRREDQSQWRHLTSLGCAVLIGLTAAKSAYMTMACFLPGTGPEAVYPEIVVLALLFHRWYVQAKVRSESGTAGLARLLWSVCAGIFTVYLHASVVSASGPEQGLCVMVLMAMAGSSVAWASASGSKGYAVLSVLFANETLAFAGSVNDIYGLALSVLGICLCAGFIWLGFFKELRSMRRLGLAGMILYVIKAALLDVQSARGSVVSTALGLLFAGLVCFAVSFVYNNLDKKYGRGEGQAPIRR